MILGKFMITFLNREKRPLSRSVISITTPLGRDSDLGKNLTIYFAGFTSVLILYSTTIRRSLSLISLSFPVFFPSFTEVFFNSRRSPGWALPSPSLSSTISISTAAPLSGAFMEIFKVVPKEITPLGSMVISHAKTTDGISRKKMNIPGKVPNVFINQTLLFYLKAKIKLLSTICIFSMASFLIAKSLKTVSSISLSKYTAYSRISVLLSRISHNLDSFPIS